MCSDLHPLASQVIVLSPTAELAKTPPSRDGLNLAVPLNDALGKTKGTLLTELNKFAHGMGLAGNLSLVAVLGIDLANPPRNRLLAIPIRSFE
jgi:hypothetical protein